MQPEAKPLSILSHPYDELPYRTFPIEWAAPERLALASLLHGSRVSGLLRHGLTLSVTFVPVSHRGYLE